MGEIVKDAAKGSPWYMYLILGVTLLLGVAGFLLPPMGVIDPSVIKFAAEILGATWLFNLSTNLPAYIAAGATIRASHGDKSIEVTPGKKD